MSTRVLSITYTSTMKKEKVLRHSNYLHKQTTLWRFLTLLYVPDLDDDAGGYHTARVLLFTSWRRCMAVRMCLLLVELLAQRILIVPILTCCRRCMAFWMCSSVWRSIPPPLPDRDRDILRSDTFFRAVSSCPAATSLNVNRAAWYRTNRPETTAKHAPTDSPNTRKHAPRPTALRRNSTAPTALPPSCQMM